MRSHPLPSRGGVRGGVCNISNIMAAKKQLRRSGSEEAAAKKQLRRSSCEEAAAKKQQRRSGSEEAAAKKRQRRSGSEEAAAKKRQRRSGSEEAAAKKQQRRSGCEKDTNPTPAPPLQGRGVPHGVPSANDGAALPSLQGEGLGVGSVISVIFWLRRNGCEETAAKKRLRRNGCEKAAAKKQQRRNGCEEAAAKKRLRRSGCEKDTDPTPAPPLQGRGVPHGVPSANDGAALPIWTASLRCSRKIPNRQS